MQQTLSTWKTPQKRNKVYMRNYSTKIVGSLTVIKQLILNIVFILKSRLDYVAHSFAVTDCVWSLANLHRWPAILKKKFIISTLFYLVQLSLEVIWLEFWTMSHPHLLTNFIFHNFIILTIQHKGHKYQLKF